VHLYRQVESLGLEALQGAQGFAGVEELLRNAGEAGEWDKAVDGRRPPGEGGDEWKADEGDLRVREP
jgi:hypothetical protein